MTTARKIKLALKIKRHGGRYPWIIIQEAEKTHLSLPLACALVEQESAFRNVFGHDAVRNPIKGGSVTKGRYLVYRNYRKQGLGMQGVGLTQLTWYEKQDRADKMGGCWKPRYQCRVGFGDLHALIQAHGRWAGIKAYNGSGPAADAYANSVTAKENKWANWLK